MTLNEPPAPTETDHPTDPPPRTWDLHNTAVDLTPRIVQADAPQVRRGGTPWPVNPAMAQAFQELRDGAPANSGLPTNPTLAEVLDTMPLLVEVPAPCHDADPAPQDRVVVPSTFEPPTGVAPEELTATHPLMRAIGRAFRDPTSGTDQTMNGAPRPEWAQGLEDWWVNTAALDIVSAIDKIVAYGGRGAAYDLIATGHDLAAMNGRRVQDAEATELAILFYLSSKVNRWMAAAIDGRAPSDDTLLDIVFYAMMARRNRVVGGWPVAPE